ncbi:MAG: YceI family protein [Candidatus Hydrogenedentes bacterium]|nr:YceI family protein [Candidatus Hydrogenedentota bacterium]
MHKTTLNAVRCGFLSLAIPVILLGCSGPGAEAPEAVASAPVAMKIPVVPSDDAQSVSIFILTDETAIGFEGAKVIGTHVGGFGVFTGTVTVPETGIEGARIDLTIDLASTYSDDTELTRVLKGEKFFDVETFPTSTFQSTRIRKTETGYEVTGNFDLHGVTKSITFPATIEISDDTLTAEAEFLINRFDFNITYPGLADDLIRKKVLVFFDLEAIRQTPESVE